jgi:hypothetical protein
MITVFEMNKVMHSKNVCVSKLIMNLIFIRGMRSYLNEKVAAPVLKTEINGRGDPLR